MTAIDTYACAPQSPVRRRCPLTPDELVIVKRLADGQTRVQIARTLAIPPQTLDKTITRMFHRLGVPNATSLVATALRNGWIR